MSGPDISSLTMREARELYFQKNGFSLEGYSASTFRLKLLGIPYKLPSTRNRRSALPLHDFHHILTGYGTTWVGESEISAWELRAGFRAMAKFGLVVYYFDISGAILGLFLSPRRVWRAFREARGQRTLFGEAKSYATFLEMTVEGLRRRQGIPPEGSAD